MKFTSEVGVVGLEAADYPKALSEWFFQKNLHPILMNFSKQFLMPLKSPRKLNQDLL
jgi:hypothetical protein